MPEPLAERSRVKPVVLAYHQPMLARGVPVSDFNVINTSPFTIKPHHRWMSGVRIGDIP
jgi:hypothetical protein